ncbi:restriction endonuclease subunit S [Herbaspirillum rubrisubalbicans Os34]|uniref:Restriction endonuclease subunit S n=1 Tax=Herbaspirillum rubrisubalbicans Os34 TaxID=1235827 RepID=A0A6M3ZJS8_9BURK|nr:restriction endonuclease subunit S [Herbaspirillum rubrisubalbicans]QJP98672.1 restriction endonuclease subunit S [Herbaspirillum rubrisubalbicans Os34]
MTFARLPFEAVFADESAGNIKTPQSEYLREGAFPVVDQGKALVGGYVEDPSRLCGEGRPAIVFGDHTRCIKYVNFPFCMGADGVKVLRPKIDADLKYLYYYLQTVRLPDAGYDRHFKYLKRTEIVVPSVPEQRRIAAILDQADLLRAKRREALAQLDGLQQAIFMEMFGDPKTNPKSLRKASLHSLLKLKSGEFLPSSEMVNTGPYPVFGGNGINGCHDKFLFDARKIVIGRVGVYCGCVHVSPARSWITDNALYVSEHDASVKFDFLSFSLKLAKLNQYASQSAQPLISGSRIYPVEILVPPIASQLEFIERAEKSKNLANANMESSKALDDLFSSLQHRAFRGEL